MEPSLSWTMLARYFAGETTPEETQAVEEWAMESSSHARLMEELRDVWEATSSQAPTPRVDLDAGWEQLMGRIEAGEPVAPGTSRRPAPDRSAHALRARPTGTSRLPRRGIPSEWLVGLALAVCLLLGTLLAEQWPVDAQETTLREVVTRRGERAHLRLTDGTQVTLNVDSKLRLPAAFADDRRHVHLTGEAYFDVAHDADRPFVVQVGHAVVNVHGTAFGVRSYPKDRRVQVAVTEGVVSLRGQEEPETRGTRLTSGQLGQLSAEDTQVKAKEIDVQEYLGWKEGRLVFNDAPLSEVAAQLERWYDLQVVLQHGDLDSLYLTAHLKSKSIRDVLDVITASLGIRYRFTGETVLLLSDP